MVGEKTAQAKKTAIEKEKSGHRYFTEASNKVKHEVGRKLFARLAAEEIDHMKTFEKIFNEVSGGADWKEAMKAIQPRKHDVQHNEVWTLPAGYLQRHQTVSGRRNLVALTCQIVFQRL